MTSCLAAEALIVSLVGGVESCGKGHAAGARAPRGAARCLILRVYGLSFRRELFVGRLKQHDKAKPLYTKLAESGVVVRYRGDQANLSGCIRVTVGTPSDSDALLKLLGEVAPSFRVLLKQSPPS